MPAMSAHYQRQRRADLKARGYKQVLLTLDPQSVSAAKYIARRTGGDLSHIIRAALLTQMQVLHLARAYANPDRS